MMGDKVKYRKVPTLFNYFMFKVLDLPDDDSILSCFSAVEGTHDYDSPDFYSHDSTWDEAYSFFQATPFETITFRNDFRKWKG